MIKVKVPDDKIPGGRTLNFTYQRGMKIEDALSAACVISAEKGNVTVNGKRVKKLTKKLKDGDKISVFSVDR